MDVSCFSLVACHKTCMLQCFSLDVHISTSVLIGGLSKDMHVTIFMISIYYKCSNWLDITIQAFNNVSHWLFTQYKCSNWLYVLIQECYNVSHWLCTQYKCPNWLYVLIQECYNVSHWLYTQYKCSHWSTWYHRARPHHAESSDLTLGWSSGTQKLWMSDQFSWAWCR